ncbi:MFS transporter [Streptomyces ipomoeae]|nr:MFS transporter [Streptomyces ipomoeae]MDX2692881.1 MFS transporter [Streptomyces ipomoeae]MDX2820198.1 MFS transporter [Streptomyces ipomoeae]MDX2840011.1 MFS transporter [Streptomyces ipomoeae]MDX2874914.1 MFS transporter [Streptomyces ipomoeae]
MPSRAPSRSPWRSLRYRSMRWWSVANLVSNVGTWMQLTVQNLLVLQITGSAAATGLSMSVQAAPALLVSLLGGAAVDRLPRKLTATVSQALLGMVAFVTALLVALDRLDMTTLLVLAAVTGTIATVDGPACALLGNDLVPAEDVPSAIGVGALVHSAGRLVGTALAGVTVGFLGTAAAYGANGLSFLFVAAVVPFLRPAPGAVPADTGVPAGAGAGSRLGKGTTAPDMTVREGLRFFARRPRLVALAGITGISSTFGRNYGLTLAVLVTGPLAGGAGAFGTVSTVLAVGGILGAVLGARLRRPSVRLVGTLAAGGALLQLAAGLSPSVAVLLVLVLPMAVLESVSDTAGTAVLQTDPPAHLRGRVLGVWGSVRTVWSLGGPPALGLLMELAGARGALVTGGLLIAGAIGTGFLLRSRRTPTPVAIPTKPGDVTEREALSTAA